MEGAGDSAEPNTSLFPIFPASDSSQKSSSDVPQWLQNTSFTTDLSVIRESVASRYDITYPVGEEEEGGEGHAQEPPQAKAPPSYDLLESSASDRDHDSDSKREKRSRKKKKRKRKRSQDAARREGDDYASRKSGVRAWEGSDTKPAKDYYFDSRGDRDNLVFGCLYRMDVARYKLQNRSSSSGSNFRVLYRGRNWGPFSNADEDIDALDGKLRSEGRYWSSKYSALERHKGFKRVRVVALDRSLNIAGEFIPFTESVEVEAPKNVTANEESWEDEVLRKTKEFNKMSREAPHDEKIWLAFAEFQDKIASRQPQKAARLQTLEKKISILEKATELNPDNEELLLCLLKAYQSRDSTEVLIERWEKILMQHSGSSKLWKEFLRVARGEFSKFKVSNTRKMYAHAIQALSSACGKLCRLTKLPNHPQWILLLFS
uniref:Protein NRDE2 homolog n=1 Tax=Nelumbo nucifera TaxID=4432 RepID=A0A822YN00_NELNU|nr:TPA_asm: hypothetical protein HUJ06_011236 [Nelumbo nucifera]